MQVIGVVTYVGMVARMMIHPIDVLFVTQHWGAAYNLFVVIIAAWTRLHALGLFQPKATVLGVTYVRSLRL
jgi:hypothetical protein